MLKENKESQKEFGVNFKNADLKENKEILKEFEEPKNETLKENKIVANLKTNENEPKENKIKNELRDTLNAKEQVKQNSTLNSLEEDLSLESSKDLNPKGKDDLDALNSLVKDLSRTTQNQVKNTFNAKETLQYFSQDLKEALEQYKPPITRLNITLNPSNLGEVEVTLIQRGNNLHINFNSNTNAMNLFIQNQAEFKNSLVNMGFTGLEMNFNDQSKKEQNQHNKNKSSLKENLDEQEALKPNLELVLAKYF